MASMRYLAAPQALPTSRGQYGSIPLAVLVTTPFAFGLALSSTLRMQNHAIDSVTCVALRIGHVSHTAMHCFLYAASALRAVCGCVCAFGLSAAGGSGKVPLQVVI